MSAGALTNIRSSRNPSQPQAVLHLSSSCPSASVLVIKSCKISRSQSHARPALRATSSPLVKSFRTVGRLSCKTAQTSSVFSTVGSLLKFVVIHFMIFRLSKIS
jgi:hypothetical protein